MSLSIKNNAAIPISPWYSIFLLHPRPFPMIVQSFFYLYQKITRKHCSSHWVICCTNLTVHTKRCNSGVGWPCLRINVQILRVYCSTKDGSLQTIWWQGASVDQQCIRLIPQGTVDNNPGPDHLEGQKALNRNYSDNQPFDCTTLSGSPYCAWYWIATVWGHDIPPTHTINVAHLT